MHQTVTRWSIYLAALFLVGPLAGTLTAALRSETGSAQATPLVSSTPVLGIAAGAAALAIALGLGLVGARLVNVHSGMTAAGLVAAWAAWRTGTTHEILREARAADPLWTLVVEGLIFAVLGVALAAALVLAAKRGDPEEPTIQLSRGGAPRPAEGFAERLRQAMPGPGTAVALLAALAAAAGAAWLIAQSPMKGQAIIAAVGAGLAAGVVGRLVDGRTPILTFFLVIGVLCVVGPATGALVAPAGGPVAAMMAGRLFPLAVPVPLDWIAGGLLGVPMGAAWAASMVEKHTAAAA